LAMSLQTPSMTGAAGDCCVEGRRRVTRRAEAARGSFALRVPRGEATRGEPDAGTATLTAKFAATQYWAPLGI
jgi:hypothetical protein